LIPDTLTEALRLADHLSSLELLFETTVTPSRWRKLHSLVACGKTCTKAELCLCALPLVVSQGDPFARLIGTRDEGNGNKLVHWRVVVNCAPSSDPPDDVRKSSSSVGHWKGFWNQVLPSLCGKDFPRIHFHVTHQFSASSWRAVFDGRSASDFGIPLANSKMLGIELEVETDKGQVWIGISTRKPSKSLNIWTAGYLDIDKFSTDVPIRLAQFSLKIAELALLPNPESQVGGAH